MRDRRGAWIAVALSGWVLSGCELFSGRATPPRRAAAEVSCQGVGDGLTLDCQVQLWDRATRQPLTGATVVGTADMPSMPLAHRVQPVAAAAVDSTPGLYRLALRVEMHGSWAVHFRISGPVSEEVVHVQDLRNP
jgi:hypothetical protein